MKFIVLRGASFSTGNLGVSALAWSAINLISEKWPGSRICLLGGREYKAFEIRCAGKSQFIEAYPVRFNLNILSRDHILRIWLSLLIRKISKTLKRSGNSKSSTQSLMGGKDNTLDVLCNAHAHFDITGGDSFSDIYGFSRFAKDALVKTALLMTDRQFILLPQTYGPFATRATRMVARYILQRSTAVAARDEVSLATVQELTGETRQVVLCPDLAFTLESRKPSGFGEDSRKIDDPPLVGINVSGLLYNGGYTGKNEFGISLDYRKLVREIVLLFVSKYGCDILLVPHVVSDELRVENDLLAAKSVANGLPREITARVSVIEPEVGYPFYDQCEIKYIIGTCDFFLGSRMHATIAALSQMIPTVALAYSRKFTGVYRTVGVEDCVVELRQESLDEALVAISNIYERKEVISQLLASTIPQARDSVHRLFEQLIL